MPKSRQRKKKSRKQYVPVEIKIPVGTREIVKDGIKSHETIIARVKTRQNKVVKHLPQKH